MNNELIQNGQLLLYSKEGDNVYIDVYFYEDSFWLTQQGIAELFDSSKSNISEHLKHMKVQQWDLRHGKAPQMEKYYSGGES